MTAFHCIMLVGLGDASRPARCSFFIFLKSLISRCRHRPGSVVSPSAATSVETAIMSRAHMSKIDVAFYTSNLAVIPGLIAQKPSQQDVKALASAHLRMR